jgi:hypothetical protein
MPYCCFSSSSVRCFAGAGCAAVRVMRQHSSYYRDSLLHSRRFLFQTWFGSGPLPALFNPIATGLDEESRSPLVVFATKRGLVLGCGEALEDVDERVPATINSDSGDGCREDGYLYHLFSKARQSQALWELRIW